MLFRNAAFSGNNHNKPWKRAPEPPFASTSRHGCRRGSRASRNSPTTSGTAGTAPTRALFARLDPALWHAVGHNPKALLKRVDQQPPRRGRATIRSSCTTTTACSPTYDTYHGRLPAAEDGAGAGRRRPGRLLLRRVRLPREPADLLRRPRHPRRRPLQDRERHARCRSSASACSTARAISRRPSTPRASSTRCTPTPISTTCRSRRSTRADGARAAT